MPEKETATTTMRCPSCGETPSGTAPAGAQLEEPLTHCEWCGAEYPQPGERDAPDAEG
jgi:hypothetical protein